MAKERKASVIYEGNASQLVYAFPFDYLRKKFVKVEDIYTNITELTIGVDYTVEDKQVRLVKGIPLGHSVKIYRETTTAPLVEWQDASVLRSADLSLQEVQLLHLAEETADKVFDSGMSTAYDNPNCWDGQYKRIINALDPIEDGDVVTLRYIKSNQDSLLNQLKNTGATQNSSIVATGDIQNKRLTDTGNAYVSTMTTLKDTATTKANDASNSAELSKKWAVSTTSPDGAADNKSSKTWAEDARKSANNSAFAATASQNSATASATSSTNASNSANASKQSANASANSASASASSASAASTSAFSAKVSETKAASSAAAAAQSAKEAATFEPTNYYSRSEVDAKIPTKVSQLTDDRGLTTTNELNTEVKKWKNAYNNLRKRSCPVEFDEDELTLLASNLPLQTSPLNLSKPYTDFDGLYIIYGESDGVTSEYIATKQIQERIHFGKPYWYLLMGVGTLYTKCDSREITTPSSIAILFNNIYIYRVYGVKLKEIT